MESRQSWSWLLDELEAVHRCAYYLSGRPEDAELVVEKVYRRGFERLAARQFGGRHPRVWLLDILCEVITCGYAGQGRGASPTGETQGRSSTARAVDTTGQQGRADLDGGRGTDERLVRAVVALPWTTRAAFLFVVVEGISCREASEVLRVSVIDVIHHIRDARAMLVVSLGG